MLMNSCEISKRDTNEKQSKRGRLSLPLWKYRLWKGLSRPFRNVQLSPGVVRRLERFHEPVNLTSTSPRGNLVACNSVSCLRNVKTCETALINSIKTLRSSIPFPTTTRHRQTVSPFHPLIFHRCFTSRVVLQRWIYNIVIANTRL